MRAPLHQPGADGTTWLWHSAGAGADRGQAQGGCAESCSPPAVFPHLDWDTAWVGHRDSSFLYLAELLLTFVG